MGPEDQISEPERDELADYGRPDESAVAGDEDLGGFVGEGGGGICGEKGNFELEFGDLGKGKV